MTAEIVKIDGTKIETPIPVADSDIQKLLDHYSDLNKCGKLKAIAIATIDVDNSSSFWHAQKPGVPTAHLLGAVAYLHEEILRSADF